MARITNLQELQAERSRLEAELELQKAIIESEVHRIKRKFDVVSRVKDFLGIGKDVRTGSAPPALKAGANLGIEIIGQRVLSRAGWITRLVVPLVAKALSSRILDRFRKKKTNTYHADDYVPQKGSAIFKSIDN
jgi:hypothetical protein